MALDDAIRGAGTVLDDALREYAPVGVFAAFSGGYDSLVSAHFTLGRVAGAAALHLNTGIGIERTREYVRRTAKDFGWPFHEVRTEESYEDLVLGRHVNKTDDRTPYAGGFPGPVMHAFMYQRLKERPLRRFAAAVRRGHPRRARARRWVMIVTGIRHDESRVRAGYKRAVSVDKSTSLVWVNPFYWATADDFRGYRARFDLPRNPVKEALGFSGECLCGAHADRGELARIRLACPATAAYLEGLERRVRAAGFPWGYEERPPAWFQEQRRGQRSIFDLPGAAGPPGPLCNACDKFAAGFGPAAEEEVAHAD
jgi:3'-phosphoadenosine 5'-phosphosulfate sulfotransferase (PAPS reductase)/FAD synthetase